MWSVSCVKHIFGEHCQEGDRWADLGVERQNTLQNKEIIVEVGRRCEAFGMRPRSTVDVVVEL